MTLFQASPDSLHGYDITDHNKLNPAIGSRADYDAWIAQLHAHGMGHVIFERRTSDDGRAEE